MCQSLGRSSGDRGHGTKTQGGPSCGGPVRVPDCPRARHLEQGGQEVKMRRRSLKERWEPRLVGGPRDNDYQKSAAGQNLLEKLSDHGGRREEVRGPEGVPVDTSTVYHCCGRMGEGGRHQVHVQRTGPAMDYLEHQMREGPLRVQQIATAECICHKVESREDLENLKPQVPGLAHLQKVHQLPTKSRRSRCP